MLLCNIYSRFKSISAVDGEVHVGLLLEGMIYNVITYCDCVS